MKLNHLNWQAVDHTLVVLGEIKHGKHHLTDMVDCNCEIAPATIEARALGHDWEQLRIGTPFTQQGGFLIPFAALAHNRHGQEFAIGAVRLWARTLIEMPNLLPNIVNEHIHPGDEVVKFRYHSCPSCCGQWFLSKISCTTAEGRRQLFLTSTWPY